MLEKNELFYQVKTSKIIRIISCCRGKIITEKLDSNKGNI